MVGENPTPYGILALWAVNGLSIVYWVHTPGHVIGENVVEMLVASWDRYEKLPPLSLDGSIAPVFIARCLACHLYLTALTLGIFITAPVNPHIMHNVSI